MTPYSPIQHLADAVFINHNSRERYFVMVRVDTSYTTYFDASGTRGTTMLVVGGYISTVEDWRNFETEWKAVLDKVGAPYFHMKKFTACRKPFDNPKWRREEFRKSFLDKLIGAIARNVDFGLVNILPVADWETVNGEYCMAEERMTPFSVAGCMAITAAYDWCKAHAIPYNQIKFIFEEGDDDKGDLMYWCKKCWKLTPIFEPKYSDYPTDHPLTPLQACDFIAWEVRRAETDLSNPETDLDTYELRRCFDELLGRIRQDPTDNKWDAANLRGLCEKHGLKKR